MTDERFDPEELTKPFPPELHKVNKFKSYKPKYVEAGHYIKVLNAATGHRWNVEILEEKTVFKVTKSGEDKKQPFFIVKIRLTIPEVGIVKESYGGSCFVGDDPEDTMKAAETDAIKKACWMLGIGVDISIDRPHDSPHDTGVGRNTPTREQWRAVVGATSMPFSAQEEKDKAWNYIEAMCMKKFGLHKEQIDQLQAVQLADWLSKGKGGKNDRTG